MTHRDDKMTDGLSDQSLEALFAEARDEAVMPSTALLAAVMADAETQIATRTRQEAARRAALRPTQRHPMLAAMVAALGGWRAVAGLASAAVTGLAIGLGAPSTVTNLATGSYSESATVETTAAGDALDALVPSFYDLALEG
ncbi:MAG: hypothetical protein KJ731_02460 [Alphaproteobacteria bacterium]|nr:hypothetical protein [Alphaproteobacteria bacterium]MBU1281539.1 hypothetical protein [Alphaproteobacteria bacterium]MBU1574228.1 hypothetical protein [Alphaproteobacteria bacterium]MBU1827328.1 hypothetical protein [Alphaproteobacteria bacterium]MBU2080075.1 hypothetical protein [Alphaproteobacteria bacterium]